jgi:hypothetical protein
LGQANGPDQYDGWHGRTGRLPVFLYVVIARERSDRGNPVTTVQRHTVNRREHETVRGLLRRYHPAKQASRGPQSSAHALPAMTVKRQGRFLCVGWLLGHHRWCLYGCQGRIVFEFVGTPFMASGARTTSRTGAMNRAPTDHYGGSLCVGPDPHAACRVGRLRGTTYRARSLSRN